MVYLLLTIGVVFLTTPIFLIAKFILFFLLTRHNTLSSSSIVPADTFCQLPKKNFYFSLIILAYYHDFSYLCGVNLKLVPMCQVKHSSLLYRQLSDSQRYEFLLYGYYSVYGVFLGKQQIAEYKTRIAADMLVKLLKDSHRNISVVQYFLIPKDM